jgi:putative endonuclease
VLPQNSLADAGLFYLVMAHVYILYSPFIDKYYIGSCNDLEERLGQHRNKDFDRSFTAMKADDWQLFFSVSDLGYEQARAIEFHIKKMKSRKYLNDLKSYPEIIERLKQKYC